MIIEYFSDKKYKYSTALMFAYINLYKPNKHKLNLDDLKFNLEYNSWTNNVRPIDVLNDMKNKKYKDEVSRIKNANIKYPIIVDSNYKILDGFHRYVKQIILNKKIINVYIFDKNLMKKFIIGKCDEKIDLQLNDYIELFTQRFRCTLETHCVSNLGGKSSALPRTNV
jgi:disulfide oxidoreductase YuzD